MGKIEKVLKKAMLSPKSLRFSEVRALAEGYGFRLGRVRGSHHIFTHSGLHELVNLQDVGGFAKPYQVRQLLSLIEKYNLVLEE
jgi:hypothetical protein